MAESCPNSSEAVHLLLDVFLVKVKGQRSFSQRRQENRYNARVTLFPVPTYHFPFPRQMKKLPPHLPPHTHTLHYNTWRNWTCPVIYYKSVGFDLWLILRHYSLVWKMLKIIDSKMENCPQYVSNHFFCYCEIYITFF